MPAQLLRNIEIVSTEDAFARLRQTAYRRVGRGILPRCYEASFSDLFIALHEAAHFLENPFEDTQDWYKETSGFALHNLGEVIASGQCPEWERSNYEEIINWASESDFKDSKFITATMTEICADWRAIRNLGSLGILNEASWKDIACLLRGVVSVQYHRKAGFMLARSSNLEEDLLQLKALTFFRLHNGCFAILAEVKEIENTVSDDTDFIINLCLFYLQTVTHINDLFLKGLSGEAYNSLTPRTLRWFDKYFSEDDFLKPQSGTTSILNLKKLTSDRFLRIWIDYSKFMRNTLEVERKMKEIMGDEYAELTEDEEYLYLTNERDFE